jgi:4-hydroxybenzoyl-CoA thioesterase
MVDTRARFTAPSTYGDEVVIDSRVTRVGRSSFDIEHRLIKGQQVCVEAFETRVWTGYAIDPPGIESVPIPAPLSVILRGTHA